MRASPVLSLILNVLIQFVVRYLNIFTSIHGRGELTESVSEEKPDTISRRDSPRMARAVTKDRALGGVHD